jgi:NUMOD4 motif
MYPYENILINPLSGETWKDIAGCEGYFQVSNLGRVKSLDRIIPHPGFTSNL